MGRFIDLTGKRFGRLVVIEQVSKTERGQSRWLCLCDCGKEKIVLGYSLYSPNGGHTQSCGCLQKEKVSAINTKHGHTKNRKRTGTYRSWDMIIQRCTNPNNHKYKDYGGSGITVCKRWLRFENFLEDMGEASNGHQIDRIKNNKGYYRENCRWATPREQQRNRSNNHLETYDGKTQCIAAWSDETGILEATILWRLKQGWSTEKAFTTHAKKYKKRKTNG